MQTKHFKAVECHVIVLHNKIKAYFLFFLDAKTPGLVIVCVPTSRDEVKLKCAAGGPDHSLSSDADMSSGVRLIYKQMMRQNHNVDITVNFIDKDPPHD